MKLILGRVHSRFRPRLSHKVASRETYIKVNRRILRAMQQSNTQKVRPAVVIAESDSEEESDGEISDDEVAETEGDPEESNSDSEE